MTEVPAKYNVKPKKGILSTPDITFKELALLNNFTQNALVELLVEKGIITKEEIEERTKQQAVKHKLRRKRN